MKKLVLAVVAAALFAGAAPAQKIKFRWVGFGSDRARSRAAALNSEMDRKDREKRAHKKALKLHESVKSYNGGRGSKKRMSRAEIAARKKALIERRLRASMRAQGGRGYSGVGVETNRDRGTRDRKRAHEAWLRRRMATQSRAAAQDRKYREVQRNKRRRDYRSRRGPTYSQRYRRWKEESRQNRMIRSKQRSRTKRHDRARYRRTRARARSSTRGVRRRAPTRRTKRRR